MLTIGPLHKWTLWTAGASRESSGNSHISVHVLIDILQSEAHWPGRMSEYLKLFYLVENENI